MQVVDFTAAHAEQAALIAKQNYGEERGHVPALPPVDKWPDLTPLAENGLGAAAVENGRVIGFLGAYGVWDNAWDIAGLRNVFSPMHANGALPENRAEIYAALYQAAGAKWAKAGAASHGICLYAHDTETQARFFRYGFGMRCIDAIRMMEPVDCAPCEEYEFAELTDCMSVYPLHLMLNEYQCLSPYFMNRAADTPESFAGLCAEGNLRFFGAGYKGELCAYMQISDCGETFITGVTEKYKHINGAFCMPEHRGRGVYQNLMNFAVSALKGEGYTRLGTDFESFNPSGAAFWLKYFTAYTHSVVRRIDESAAGN